MSQSWYGDYEPRRRLKHSGIGIASFIVSIVTGVLMLGVFVVAGVVAASNPAAMEDEKSGGVILLGLGILGLLVADVLALVFGIVAVFQTDRQRILGILGAIFSGLTILATVALIIIGNLMK